MYILSSSLCTLKCAKHVVDLSFDTEEFHVVIRSPFENRHVVGLGIFAEKALIANGMAQQHRASIVMNVQAFDELVRFKPIG